MAKSPIKRRVPKVVADDLREALEFAQYLMGEDAMKWLEKYRKNMRMHNINAVKQGLTASRKRGDHAVENVDSTDENNPLQNIEYIPANYQQALSRLDEAFEMMHLHDESPSDFISEKTLAENNSILGQRKKISANDPVVIAEEEQAFINAYRWAEKSNFSSKAEEVKAVCKRLCIGKTKYYKLRRKLIKK